MEVVKNLQVSVPFTKLVTQVPVYAKFLKEILSKKRSFDEVETVAFTHECYAALQANFPPKLKDPGSFYIPCNIDLLAIDNALCDLGASEGHFCIQQEYYSRAVINVRHGSLTFNIGDDTITFGLDKASRPPNSKAYCHMINALDPTFDDCLTYCFDRN
ncbi:uncharacterized protein LOC141655571 [Silene latifolia]|uniref:uncharacterized protein LOC141655571 n=1 Tax=Silene latifolia TaxID=37657 RepID=UPI003D76DEC1